MNADLMDLRNTKTYPCESVEIRVLYLCVLSGKDLFKK